MDNNIKTAIGLMSGTSLDGIDVALIKSDGKKIISKGNFKCFPYEQKLKDQIKKLIGNQLSNLFLVKEIENEITLKHVEAVENFLRENNLSKNEIDVIGFHGQTIYHKPQKCITWQIGNSQMLASKTGINVIGDFRVKDVVLGGQGAPLVPIYHQALFKDYEAKPVIILNIGGVSNITFIRDDNENNLIAFDTCFGNAPMDDLIKEKTGQDFDDQGKLAKAGQINIELAEEFLALEYFSRTYPKSLDRNQFNPVFSKIYSLPLNDALATLSYILGHSINTALKLIHQNAGEIIVCGGGRKNLTLMENIQNATKLNIINIDDLGINGDAVEAEAFAFLAIRSLLNLPITFTKTTGVLPATHDPQPSVAVNFSSCGGVFYRA